MVTRWNRRASGVVLMVLSVGVAGVVVRAAGLTSKYDAELRRLRGEWRAAQQAEGLDPAPAGAKALYTRYPTPEITLCKPVVIAPGAVCVDQPHRQVPAEDDVPCRSRPGDAHTPKRPPQADTPHEPRSPPTRFRALRACLPTPP